MDKYELTVVMTGKSTPAKVKAFGVKLEKFLSAYKGKVADEKSWGVIDLAYKIKKEVSGLFTHYMLEMDRNAVSKLNESLRTDEGLLRHLLVKVETK